MSADDLLPPDEPLDRRVTIRLAKIGIALKQQSLGRGRRTRSTPTQGQVLALRGRSGGSATARPGGAARRHCRHTSDSVAALHARAWSRNRQRATAGEWSSCRLPLAAARRPPPLLSAFYWRRSASSRLPSRPHSCVRSSR